MKNTFKATILSLLVAFIAACGGGSETTGRSAWDSKEIPKTSQKLTYAVTTIEKYPLNPLAQHSLGDAVEADLKTAGWTGSRYKDEEVTTSLFIGHQDFPDLIMFGGHGTHYGPALLTDTNWSMVQANYYWGESSKPLRWMLNDSCVGLNDGAKNLSDAPQWAATEESHGYSLNAWLQAVNWGNSGTHAYFAHRGFAWANQPGTGSSYAIRQSLKGQGLGQAWFDSAALDIANGVSGVLPAVLSAYDPSANKDWFNESLMTPWADPNPSVKAYGLDHSNLAYHFAIYGSPVMPSIKFSTNPQEETKTLLSKTLAAFPHKLEVGKEVTFEVQGMQVHQFLSAMNEPQQTKEILHQVQYGYGSVALVDRLLAFKTHDGYTMVLRVSPDDALVNGLISK